MRKPTRITSDIIDILPSQVSFIKVHYYQDLYGSPITYQARETNNIYQN